MNYQRVDLKELAESYLNDKAADKSLFGKRVDLDEGEVVSYRYFGLSARSGVVKRRGDYLSVENEDGSFSCLTFDGKAVSGLIGVVIHTPGRVLIEPATEPRSATSVGFKELCNFDSMVVISEGDEVSFVDLDTMNIGHGEVQFTGDGIPYLHDISHGYVPLDVESMQNANRVIVEVKKGEVE